MRDATHKAIFFLTILISASFAAIVYLSNLQSAAFDLNFYEKEFSKNNVYSGFNASVNLSTETQILIDYLEDGKGEIASGFFNAKEKQHLVEVRGLFRLVSNVLAAAFFVSLISLLVLVILLRKKFLELSDKESNDYVKQLVSLVLIISGAVVDGIAVLFSIMAVTFSSSFITFHEMLFKTDTWLLNPATDNLIRMLPEQFFFDIFVKIIFTSVIFATVLLAAGFAIRLGKPGFMKGKSR